MAAKIETTPKVTSAIQLIGILNMSGEVIVESRATTIENELITEELLFPCLEVPADRTSLG